MRHELRRIFRVATLLTLLLAGCAPKQKKCVQQEQEQGQTDTCQVDSKAVPALTPEQKAKQEADDEQKAKDKLAAEKGFAKDVLPLFIDSAKVFAQMSIAALGLTIIFREKVLGQAGPMKVNWLMVGSWACYLITFFFSLVYQWLAIRLISLRNHYEDPYFPLTIRQFYPGNIYGAMLITFFIGSLLLVVGSSIQLLSKREDSLPDPTPPPAESPVPQVQG